jgi:hypothetical protein
MLILFLIVFYPILFAVAFFAPIHVKLVVFVGNLFVPDPLPFVDEIVQIAGLLKG